MNNEFKKSKSNNETRYTLESMTAGATGSGSIATSVGSVGKVQKRGNILAQEADKKKEPPKPRNFVAKNAKMGGAGKMQDKSKTIPRKEKHKKPVAEGIGGLGYDAQSLITKLRRDVEEKRLKPTPEAVLAAARELAGDMEFAPQLLVQQVLGKGVAEGFNGEYDDEAGMAHSNLLTTARAVMGLLKTIKDRDNLPEWGQEKIAKAEMMLVSVWDYLQSQKEMGNDPQVAEDSIRSNLVTALQGLGFKGPFKLGQLPQWMKELQDGRFDKDTSIMIGGDDPAYDPWVAKGYDYGYAYGMESGYQTGLSAQEVIRQAKSDMSQGQDVAEGDRTMSRAAKGHEKYGKAGMAALAKAGRDGAGEETLDKIRDKHDKYNEGVAGPEKCWPGHRKVGTKPGTGKNAGKRVNDCEKIGEAVEDRTSYQVAKILFDKGVKYDAAKENELINMIGMVLVKELMMTPKQARYLISYDEDFVADTLGELGNMESSVSEVAPPGWDKTVKAMKKHDEIDNPFALAWHMKNKGYKSHKKKGADPYFESLASKLDDLKKKK